jgi:hypothetical protein
VVDSNKSNNLLHRSGPTCTTKILTSPNRTQGIIILFKATTTLTRPLIALCPKILTNSCLAHPFTSERSNFNKVPSKVKVLTPQEWNSTKITAAIWKWTIAQMPIITELTNSNPNSIKINRRNRSIRFHTSQSAINPFKFRAKESSAKGHLRCVCSKKSKKKLPKNTCNGLNNHCTPRTHSLA